MRRRTAASPPSATEDGRVTPQPPPGDGQLWFDFIAAQVTAEHDRRTSVDSRGTSILSTSGVFFTAVFAVGAFVLGKDFKPDRPTTILVAVALGAFIVAALLAIIATALRGYHVSDVRSLRRMTSDGYWPSAAAVVRRELAATNVTTVKTLRKGNESKALLVTIAASFQWLALAALGAARMLAVVRHQ